MDPFSWPVHGLSAVPVPHHHPAAAARPRPAPGCAGGRRGNGAEGLKRPLGEQSCAGSGHRGDGHSGAAWACGHGRRSGCSRCGTRARGTRVPPAGTPVCSLAGPCSWGAAGGCPGCREGAPLSARAEGRPRARCLPRVGSQLRRMPWPLSRSDRGSVGERGSESTMVATAPSRPRLQPAPGATGAGTRHHPAPALREKIALRGRRQRKGSPRTHLRPSRCVWVRWGPGMAPNTGSGGGGDPLPRTRSPGEPLSVRAPRPRSRPAPHPLPYLQLPAGTQRPLGPRRRRARWLRWARRRRARARQPHGGRRGALPAALRGRARRRGRRQRRGVGPVTGSGERRGSSDGPCWSPAEPSRAE